MYYWIGTETTRSMHVTCSMYPEPCSNCNGISLEYIRALSDENIELKYQLESQPGVDMQLNLVFDTSCEMFPNSSKITNHSRRS